ncbi:MAG: hypothetical protein SOV62_06390 [Alloprevotella sp.]|nr:hypothetical protein [Alloprevotella sp.]
MKKIFGGIFGIAGIILILRYLLQISIWTRWIQPLVVRKPKPVITFADGTDVITIPKYPSVNIDTEIDKRLNKEHERLPYVEMVDPYLNPFMAMQNNTSNNRIYNELLQDYFEKKEVEYKNLVTSEDENRFMIPIQLIIENRGCVPCGKTDIDIEFSNNNHVYLSNAKEMIKGYSFEEPIHCPTGMFPCLDMKKVPYSYEKWNFDKFADKKLAYKMEGLNQHRKDETLIGCIYVDSRFETHILIDWTIVEPSYSTPLTGELVINIV